MKKRKFLSVILIIVMLAGILLVPTMCKKLIAFKPIMRFAVASDVHVEDDNLSLVEEARLVKMFEMAYNHAEKSASGYTGLDAVLFAGDFSNRGTLTSMQRFKSIVDENIKEGTELVVSLGNHEFFTDAETTEARYTEVFSKPVDEHIVISGFHFIKLSPNGEYFSEEKLNWLRNELKVAAEDTPNSPIFVMQHQHVKGTVYGSGGWGADGLYEILAEYPQVVDFSGHSHFPISDDRSLWQDEFTAIGTGTLSYMELGLNGVAEQYLFPHGHNGDYKLYEYSGERDYGVFQIVEIDKRGNLQIIGYDITTESELFVRKINSPKKISFYETTEFKEEHTQIPEFAKGSEIRVESRKDGISLFVDQAKSRDYIESYRAEVFNEYGLVGTYYALSGHAFRPIPDKVCIRLGNIDISGEYYVKIYAVNSYGKSSTKPLEIKLEN